MDNQKKVLFINAHDIWKNCNSGGAQCSKRNYELIVECYGKENVNVLSFIEDKSCIPTQVVNDEKIFLLKKNISKIDALIAAVFLEKLYMPWHEKNVIKIIQTINPDIIFFDTTLLGKLMCKLKKNRKTKMFVFMHNVEVNYTKNKVKNEGLRFLPSYWASWYNEKCSVREADFLITLNDRDKKEVRRIYGRESDMNWPITFADCFDNGKVKQIKENSKELLFVGSAFAPNLDGVRWFYKEVLPKLEGFTLVVVGKDFEKYRNEFTDNNVKIVGTVADLEEYYYSYPVVVIPIRYGDGMKVKTAEALMYGKTIFSTSEGLEGYITDKVEGIFECNSVEEFVENIKKYYKHERIVMYQQTVREHFLNGYDTNKLHKDIHEKFEKI